MVETDICTVSDLIEYIKEGTSPDAPIKRLGLFLTTDEVYIILNNDIVKYNGCTYSSGKIHGGTFDGVTHLRRKGKE